MLRREHVIGAHDMLRMGLFRAAVLGLIRLFFRHRTGIDPTDFPPVDRSNGQRASVQFIDERQ